MKKSIIFKSAVLSIASCSLVTGGRLSAQSTTEKPNFLFILTDDQTYESIHALNNQEISTPNMDRLVGLGTSFTHAFIQGSWAGAVCVASRSMLLTGQTLFHAPRNIKYLDDWSQLYGPAQYQLKKEPGVTYPVTEVKTWAETLDEAGYFTYQVGKWHNSEYALMKGFNEAQCLELEGMCETFDENGSSALTYSRPNGGPWTPWDRKYKGHWAPRLKDMLTNESGKKFISPYYTAEQHTSELYTDRAVNLLQTRVPGLKAPFFIEVEYSAPHDPRQSPKEYVEMSDRQKITVPENFLPEFPFDQGDHKIRDERLAPFPRTGTAIQLHRQEYYAAITYLDHELGRILDALEKSGKMDNTYIIFTSDNGLAIGQHGLMGKQNQFDHSIRVPLIICGPGIKKGFLSDEMVYIQSAFATTCELAGIPIPETVELGSLVNIMKGQKGGEKYIFGAYRHLQRMVRSKEFKLIGYPEVKRIQLFDMINDPKEMCDLAADKSYDGVKQKLFDQLVKMQKELDDFLILNRQDYPLLN